MSQRGPSWGFRKPSKTVFWLMASLFFVWVTFAMALNWGGAGESIVRAIIGDSRAVLQGQVWRLLTAGLFNEVSGGGAVFRILIALLLLYFFLPPLEERWGSKRLLLFLAGATAFAFAVETLMHLVISVARAQWFGSMVMADAAIVAWAIGARGEVVRFNFIIPMKPMVMVGIVVALNVLQLIAGNIPSEGFFAPFAAMGAGFLFGGDSSPLRRMYLKWKLQRLQSEVSGLQKKRRKNAPDLRVIKGGSDDDDDEDRFIH